MACFVTLKKGEWNHQELSEELRKWVAHEIGSFAKPEQIRFTDALPKTRSGKIMRRLLREIVSTNAVTGDVTTLEDLSVVTRLAARSFWERAGHLRVFALERRLACRRYVFCGCALSAQGSSGARTRGP